MNDFRDAYFAKDKDHGHNGHGSCPVKEAIKELKKGLKQLKEAEKDIKKGICDIEKGIDDLEKSLCFR